MKTTNQQKRIILGLFILGMLFPLGAETGENVLWGKVREYYQETTVWKPASITTTIKEYNHKGQQGTRKEINYE